MEDPKEKYCWNYVDIGVRNEAPVIQVEIIIGSKSYSFNFMVDTGYDGCLLIPYTIYKQLGLEKFELPKDEWSVGETVSGEIFPLASALCKIKVADMIFECVIETFEDNSDFLVGLDFLQKFNTVLQGPKQKICLLKYEETVT